MNGKKCARSSSFSNQNRRSIRLQAYASRLADACGNGSVFVPKSSSFHPELCLDLSSRPKDFLSFSVGNPEDVYMKRQLKMNQNPLLSFRTKREIFLNCI